MREVDGDSLLCCTEMTRKESNVFVDTDVLLLKVDSLYREP